MATDSTVIEIVTDHKFTLYLSSIIKDGKRVVHISTDPIAATKQYHDAHDAGGEPESMQTLEMRLSLDEDSDIFGWYDELNHRLDED